MDAVILDNPSFSDYTKVELKHCWPDKYGSYNTLDDAKAACTADSNCGGVYDLSCDGAPFYLCPETATLYTSSASCVYCKGRFIV